MAAKMAAKVVKWLFLSYIYTKYLYQLYFFLVLALSLCSELKHTYGYINS